MTIPTESELAQAYAQGYQDGRRGLEELIEALRDPTPAMIKAGITAMVRVSGLTYEQLTAVVTNGWRAMFDASQESDGIAEKMVRLTIAQTHEDKTFQIIHSAMKNNPQTDKRISELEAELSSCKTNAARYGWLRQNHKGRVEVIILKDDCSEHGSTYDRMALDRDIDTALKGAK